MTPAFEGGCLCGAVRYRVTAAPLRSGYCHCRMCQKNSGTPEIGGLTSAQCIAILRGCRQYRN